MPSPSLSPSTLDRFRTHAVPVVILSIVVVVISIVPPLVLGSVTTRTYAITAAVVILAVGSVLPYALLVSVGTLPLLYAGIASFAAPQSSAETAHSFSTTAALRHSIAGIAYVLSAAVVGAIGLGAQMGAPDELAGVSAAVFPSFLVIGGASIGVAFVALQLWRHESSIRLLDRGTILGTTVLGSLIAVAPMVAFWVFNNA